MNKLIAAGGLLVVTVTAFGLGTVSTLITQAADTYPTWETSQTWDEHVAKMKESWELRQKMKDSITTTVKKTDNGIVVTRTSDDQEVIDFLHEHADKIESGDFGHKGGPRHMMGF